MSTSIFAIRTAGKLLSEAYKTKLLEKPLVSLGFASPQEGKTVSCNIAPGDEIDLKDALDKFDETFKDDALFIHAIVAGDNNVDFDSLQPFKLLTNGKEGEEEIVYLAAMMAAEFPTSSSEDPEDLNTNDWRFVQTFLQPQIEELWDMSGGNDPAKTKEDALTQLLVFFDRKVFKDKVLAQLQPKGNLILIPAKGAVVGFAQNNGEEGGFDWGFSTQSFGLVTEKVAVKVEGAPATAGAPLTMRQKAERAKAKAIKAAEKEAEPVVQPDKKKEFIPPPGGTEIKTVEDLYAPLLQNEFFYINGGVLFARPSKKQDWQAAKGMWHRNSTLACPKTDTAAVYVGWPFDKCLPTAPLRDLKAKLMGEKPKPKEAETEQGPAAPDPKIVEGKEKKPAQMTLLIPADQRAAYVKFKNSGNYKLTTQEALQNAVNDHPFASLQLGEQGLTEILLMEPMAYLTMPGHVRACFMHEMRCRILGIERTKLSETEKHVLAQTELKPTGKKTVDMKAIAAARKTG